jgi:hypothetical protein
MLPMRDAGDLFVQPIKKTEYRDRNKETPASFRKTVPVVLNDDMMNYSEEISWT